MAKHVNKLVLFLIIAIVLRCQRAEAYYLQAELINIFNKNLIDEFFSDNSKSNQHQLTCFTCDKSNSNEECNRKAIDEPCFQSSDHQTPSNELLFAQNKLDRRNIGCLTVHNFDAMSKKTISIEKKCSLNCTMESVGCSTTTLSTDSEHNKQFIKVIFDIKFIRPLTLVFI